MTTDETQEDVFDEVVRDLMSWRWECWTSGSAAEFQAKLDQDTAALKARFDAARQRENAR